MSDIYCPTHDEQTEYANKMHEQNEKNPGALDSPVIRSPIQHYQTYFSSNFTTLQEAFPYAAKVMEEFGYEGKITGNFITWTKK